MVPRLWESVKICVHVVDGDRSNVLIHISVENKGVPVEGQESDPTYRFSLYEHLSANPTTNGQLRAQRDHNTVSPSLLLEIKKGDGLVIAKTLL